MPSSDVPGMSRVKIEWKNARSTGRMFDARHWSSFLRRSANVGEPSPVQTNASRTSRATVSGWASANAAARSAPDDAP